MCVDEAGEPFALPITGELDLHTFRPADIGPLLDGYFGECRRLRIYRIRVIHGKGLGVLRGIVHAHLRRSPGVARMAACDELSGGWGATWVFLEPDHPDQ